MKYDFKKHIIRSNASVRECLKELDLLSYDAILFLLDDDDILVGSLTDGDIRRGLINGLTIESGIINFINKETKFIQRGKYSIDQIIKFREDGYMIIPILNNFGRMINVLNFRNTKSYLPLDVVIMAGGRGERLKPLTNETPKPLLKVGDKEIIRHNLDRLINFGIDDFHISVKYLADKIISNIGNGTKQGVKIKYIVEEQVLGTIGALSLIKSFEHDYIMVTNSDILTNLDYEKFFIDFLNSDSDMSIATIPYNVNIPYAILETEKNNIINFQEKPTYTYYANAGIYLFKKQIVDFIPKNEFFNATDLLDTLLKNNSKVTYYPLRGYWLDIGKHEDYKKANEDINFINF